MAARRRLRNSRLFLSEARNHAAMRDRRSTTAAVIAGAAVLATGAYALGTQEGGGGASAATAAPGHARPWAGPNGMHPPGPGMRFRRPGFGPGLSAMAQKLGVSEAKLRSALAAVRPGLGGRRAGLADLADALGITQAKLRAAFQKVEQARRDALASALAKQLGLPESKVRAALESLPHPPGHP
jgi:hypothetical protein